MKIENSRVLITGGSSGIGKAIAKQLANKGAKVLITGRDESKLSRVGKALNVASLCVDVSKVDEIKKTFDWIEEHWEGKLDVLVNNAGVGYRKTLDEVEWKDFEKTFHVNVFGAALMAKHAIAIFKKQGSGNIVNICSTAASKGYPTGTVYAASKFALKGMTLCWQAELRPHNIRVMLINPSEVTTAFAQANREERKEVPNKLSSNEIAHVTTSALEMDDRGFVQELTVWATNPF